MSLPELLVVVAVLALVAMVALPLAGRRVHQIKLQATVQQFVVALRAARMIAVTERRLVRVTVTPCPTNAYAYTDARGASQSILLPPGVWIDPGSTQQIDFTANGSVAAAATTVIESRYSGRVERWTVSTPIGGIPNTITESGSSSSYGALPCDTAGGP